MGFATVAVVFIIVAVPVLGLIALRAYWMWLRDRLLQRLLDERKLLIDRGVTDLPPLQLPETALAGDSVAPAAITGRPRTGFAWAGVILLMVASLLLAFGVNPRAADGTTRQEPELLILGLVAALLGLLMLAVYAIVRAAGRGNGRSYQPQAAEGLSPAAARRGSDPLANMKAGIVLLFLAGGFVVSEKMTPLEVPCAGLQLHVAVFLAAIGLPLLVIQAITAFAGRAEQPPREDQS